MALATELEKGEFGTYRIYLRGSLDSEGYQQFDRTVSTALDDSDVKALRLELQELRFISSLGLGSIIKARKAIESRGGVLAIVGAQPQVAKVFEIVRMLPSETVFATREEADEYLATIQKRVLEALPGDPAAGLSNPM